MSKLERLLGRRVHPLSVGRPGKNNRVKKNKRKRYFTRWLSLVV